MARPRKRPATRLSDLLDTALQKQSLTHNQFSALVNLNPSHFSDLKLKQEAPAPDRATVGKWATVLDLGKAETDELFELVQLAHAPRYVQELVAKLKRQSG